MNDDWSQVAANAIAGAAYAAQATIQEAAWGFMRPSVLYRPAISIDGNMWCALYGADLQEGVAGFGKSPAEAMDAFDKAWTRPLTALGEPKP